MEAFLMEDYLVLGAFDMQDIINDLFEDWCQFGKDNGPFVLPQVVRGEFVGYVDGYGWPIGVFFARDGRVFEAGNDYTRELVAV